MTNSFGISLIPPEEEERLEALYRLDILDSISEGPFENIAAYAVQKFQVPIAIISLVDKYRVWYKASIGLEGLKEVPRGDSLCSLVILQDAVTVFNNALQEPCLLANPFVAGEFGLRFFAGAPIKTTDGFRIGALCIIDKQARELSAAETAALESLAAFVMEKIRLRLIHLELD
jgi:GAF domain-containing protein